MAGLAPAMGLLCSRSSLGLVSCFQELTMSAKILELAYQLTQAGESFVLATVVWCERPTSAKPGAQAIVQSDGRITGWIGGSCAQPIVLREAMRMLREGGDPYLLRLGSSGAANL